MSQRNPIKGQTPLVLSDGREFTLVLDHEAMLGIEQAYGKPLPKVMAEAQEGFLSAIAAIAQAAFTRFHPDITRSDVIQIVMSENREAVTAALGQAADNAFPEAKPEVGNATPKSGKSKPRGKTSGRNGAKRG